MLRLQAIKLYSACKELFYIGFAYHTNYKKYLYFSSYRDIIGAMRLNINRIEKRRKRMQLTKTALANKAGISKQLLHYYLENPQVINCVQKIADALEINPKLLLE